LQKRRRTEKCYWYSLPPVATDQVKGIKKAINRQANENRESEFFFMKIKNVFPGFP
jgi:hypothetical protein